MITLLLLWLVAALVWSLGVAAAVKGVDSANNEATKERSV